jgi:hypothetical protein
MNYSIDASYCSMINAQSFKQFFFLQDKALSIFFLTRQSFKHLKSQE